MRIRDAVRVPFGTGSLMGVLNIKCISCKFSCLLWWQIASISPQFCWHNATRWYSGYVNKYIFETNRSPDAKVWLTHWYLISLYAVLGKACNPIGHSMLPGLKFQSRNPMTSRWILSVGKAVAWETIFHYWSGDRFQPLKRMVAGGKGGGGCVVLCKGSLKRQVRAAGLGYMPLTKSRVQRRREKRGGKTLVV